MSDATKSLSCSAARELAAAWIDGELGDERALAAHLAGCGDCRAFVDDARLIRGELARLAHAATPDAWPRIAARLPRPSRTRVLAPRLAAAFVGCAGALALLKAAERGDGVPAASLESSLARIAAIEGAPAELRRAAESPERQLLLAVATQTEERR
jgi:hypothetical protein